MTIEINKIINNLKKEIRDTHSYRGKRWKRGYWNQPGVYDVKLNISQIETINKCLKNIEYQEHLKKHWRDMYREIVEDYNKRRI